MSIRVSQRLTNIIQNRSIMEGATTNKEALELTRLLFDNYDPANRAQDDALRMIRRMMNTGQSGIDILKEEHKYLRRKRPTYRDQYRREAASELLNLIGRELRKRGELVV